MFKRAFTIVYIIAVLLVMCACNIDIPDYVEDSYDFSEVNIDELDLTEASEIISSLDVSASGTLFAGNEYANIDYSNISHGYVMVQYLQDLTQKIKVQIKGPTETYTYSITDNEWCVLPLTDGDGHYQVAVYSNIVDSKYALVFSVDFDVTLENEFEPFLRPNMYVNYSKAPKAVAVARLITEGKETTLDKIAAVYMYVTYNITYDNELARSVKSGYVPDIDLTLEKKSGICFDYASLSTGMIRSLGIPCKLVVGYAGDAYHAWISVFSQEEGWIDDIIHFDGETWQFMDPTFAAADDYNYAQIGDGSNYTAQYYY